MTKPVFVVALILALSGLLAACGAASAPELLPAPEVAPREPAYASDASGGRGDAAPAPPPLTQMIIWNATLQLTVQDTRQAMTQVQALARSLGGYSIGSESWLQNNLLYARLTIRVPAERFEEAMARLRQLAVQVRRESAASEDVTDEYVDLESRLRHLQAKEAQLTEFLDRAEDTEAVLAVYEQLAATQAEIEQVKGRMAYLEKLSALATITVELYPEEAARPVLEASWRPLSTVRNAARALVETLQGLGDVVIWFAVLLLPLLLLIALPALVVVWAIRRRRRPLPKT